MTLTIANSNAINSAAENILSSFPDAHIFAFYGEMGAGKTTLIKALCLKLGVKDAMSSPTYAIVNQYNGNQKIYHIDLYRLKDLKEALSIGIEEYLISSGSYCFIEWPELIEPLLHVDTVRIYMTVQENCSRELVIEKI